MGEFFYNLMIILDWVFIGPWNVAPSQVGLGFILVATSVSFARLCPRIGVLTLSAIVPIVAAALHILLIVLVRGLSPLILLGFVGSAIAFYPVTLVLLMMIRYLSKLWENRKLSS